MKAQRNAVEGKFGNGKRRLGLGRIMAKLRETTGSMVAMDLFVMNIEHRMRICAAFCYEKWRFYVAMMWMEIKAEPVFWQCRMQGVK